MRKSRISETFYFKINRLKRRKETRKDKNAFMVYIMANVCTFHYAIALEGVYGNLVPNKRVFESMLWKDYNFTPHGSMLT
jgi:hypothetical protein